MSSSQVLIIVIVVLGIIALAAAAWYLMRRRELQQRFGPEYERTVEESDNRLAAEKELRERESRHAELELRELEPEARARYPSSGRRSRPGSSTLPRMRLRPPTTSSPN